MEPGDAEVREAHRDENGDARCHGCGGPMVETERHPSHTEEQDGATVTIHRVWGRCDYCAAPGWWRTSRDGRLWRRARLG